MIPRRRQGHLGAGWEFCQDVAVAFVRQLQLPPSLFFLLLESGWQLGSQTAFKMWQPYVQLPAKHLASLAVGAS